MTTEENFFVRQDVTGFFTMLQGSPGAGWGFGFGRVVWIRSRGAGWGFGVGIRGGDSSPARGGVGIRAPGCGVGWGFRPGAGWSGDSGPGAGCGGDSGPGRRVCGDSGPSAGWEFFGVRWEIFYLFAVFSPFG